MVKMRNLLNEYDKTNPISPYGLQKLYGEKLCKYYSEIYKLNTVCLRYFNVMEIDKNFRHRMLL